MLLLQLVPQRCPALRAASVKPMGPREILEYLTVEPGLLEITADGTPDEVAQEPRDTPGWEVGEVVG